MNQSFFLDRASGWHALHPLTKLAVMLAILVSAFSVRWMFVSVALFVCVIVPIAVWGRIWREVLRTTFTVVLPLAISLVLVQGFFYPGAHDVILQIGPFALKREGLEFAFVTGTRLIVIAGAGLLVVYATHPADLALALVQAVEAAARAAGLRVLNLDVRETQDRVVIYAGPREIASHPREVEPRHRNVFQPEHRRHPAGAADACDTNALPFHIRRAFDIRPNDEIRLHVVRKSRDYF